MNLCYALVILDTGGHWQIKSTRHLLDALRSIWTVVIFPKQPPLTYLDHWMTSPIVEDLPDTVSNAFHGTDAANIPGILNSGFQIGRDRDLFLGDGAYFYQGSLMEAEDFAVKIKKFKKVRVVRATIKMGRCLDLDTREHRQLLEDLENRLLETPGYDTVPLPFAINTLSRFVEFDTVKKTVQKPVRPAHFKDSQVYSYTKTMIAVRSPDAIVDTMPVD